MDSIVYYILDQVMPIVYILRDFDVDLDLCECCD